MWLNKDAQRIGVELINSAVYSVYEYDVEGKTNRSVLAKFTKEFPSERPMASVVEPKDDQPVYANSPKFVFTKSDEKATAYRLQIRAKGAVEATYDSGIAMLPGRVGSTVGVVACEITPPVYADAPV